MQILLDALRNALLLIVNVDSGVLQYAGRSLWIALSATLVASLIGIPLGMLIAERSFPGKRMVVVVLNTLLALPTVVVGLLVYLFLSRTGPLGALELLFTVPGVIIGEVLLIIPIVTAFTLSAVQRTDHNVRRTALALGANSRQALWIVFRESRFGILAAVIAAFGRVISEVGLATIVGGNIEGFTRTMTTAIGVSLDMGDLSLALALGLVLLTISFSVNMLLQLVQGGARQ